MEYGLIGETLGHSYSPLIHRIMGDYDYKLYPMPRQEMEETIRKRAFRGLNVTIPYKTAVLPFCDDISPAVQEAGSANTLVVRGGRLYADNTDLAGMAYMLRRAGISLAGKKTVILGSGGTSLTAQALCRREGAGEWVVVSRSGPVDYESLYARHTDAQVMINATPVGMYPHNLSAPVSLARFPRLQGVLDVIYNPARTALLMEAEQLGVPRADGLWMLAAQAWHAARLFTGGDIPEEKIALAYRAVRRECLNLVLIGMPGCGKTTLGTMAARAMGRRFVDLDAEIEKRYGPIPDIFAARGEEAFRDMESEIAREFGRESGCVIATGGGAVLREENRKALRQNGVIAWVQRPLEQLSTAGRPLSAGSGALRRMEETRLPLYRAFADFSVTNHDGVLQAAQRLREGFDEAVDSQWA